MSFFKSWRSHYAAGCAYGLLLNAAPIGQVPAAIASLDRWAWQREWRQNLKAKNPNPELSEHQLREAAAWGAGARAASEMQRVPYPSPPYPEGYEWS